MLCFLWTLTCDKPLFVQFCRACVVHVRSNADCTKYQNNVLGNCVYFAKFPNIFLTNIFPHTVPYTYLIAQNVNWETLAKSTFTCNCMGEL